MSSSGTSQVPNAHSITDSPLTVACTAEASALRGSSRICAPASTLIAVAPMNTQYAGVSWAGCTRKASSAPAISVARIRYRTTPTAQQHTAKAVAAAGIGRGSDSSATATDWVATGHRNQVPLAAANGIRRGAAPPLASSSGMA